MGTGLLAEIQSEGRRSGPSCTLGLLLESLSEQDANDLRAALNDRSIFGSTIAKVLAKRGHDIKGSTVQRHRKRECTCP